MSGVTFSSNTTSLRDYSSEKLSCFSCKKDEGPLIKSFNNLYDSAGKIDNTEQGKLYCKKRKSWWLFRASVLVDTSLGLATIGFVFLEFLQVLIKYSKTLPETEHDIVGRELEIVLHGADEMNYEGSTLICLDGLDINGQCTEEKIDISVIYKVVFSIANVFFAILRERIFTKVGELEKWPKVLEVTGRNKKLENVVQQIAEAKLLRNNQNKKLFIISLFTVVATLSEEYEKLIEGDLSAIATVVVLPSLLVHFIFARMNDVFYVHEMTLIQKVKELKGIKRT